MTTEQRVEALEAEVERLRAKLQIAEAARWGGEVGDGLPSAIHVGYVFDRRGALVGMFHHPNEKAVDLKTDDLVRQGYVVQSVRYIRVEVEA